MIVIKLVRTISRLGLIREVEENERVEESEWIRSIEVLDAGGGLLRTGTRPEVASAGVNSMGIRWSRRSSESKETKKAWGKTFLPFLLLKKRLGCHVLVHVYSGGETCSKRVSVKLGQT